MTKTNAVEADELVQKFLKKEDQKTLDKIVSGIEKVVKHTPAIYDEEKLKEYLTKRSDLLKRLVDDYLNAIISQEFPRLSEELFELKKHFLIKKDEKNKLTVINESVENIKTKEEKEKIEKKEYYEATIPLFICTDVLKTDDSVELTKIKTHTKKRIAGDYYRNSYVSNITKTTTIEAKFSETKQNTIKENYEKGVEALSKYYSTLKSAYKNQTIKEILMQTNIEPPTLGVVWAPKLDELNIKPNEKMRKDRSKLSDAVMLVLYWKEKQYLITTLKTKEDSVDKYLKELTVDVEK